MLKKYLSITESSEYLGVSKSLLYKLSMNSNIPKYKPNSGKIFFLVDDLDKWLEAGRCKSRLEITQEVENNIKVK